MVKTTQSHENIKMDLLILFSNSMPIEVVALLHVMELTVEIITMASANTV